MRSQLERTIAAMVGIVEDPGAPLPQRTKAGETIRQLIKLRPPKPKRLSQAARLALKSLNKTGQRQIG